MPQAASARPRSHLSLNSDGQRHPVENSLAVFTLITGLAAFAVGWVVHLHLPATVLGGVSLLVGLYAQTDLRDTRGADDHRYGAGRGVRGCRPRLRARRLRSLEPG